MKLTTFALAALTGAAYALPTLPPFTIPGGDHDYTELTRRSDSDIEKRAMSAGRLAVYSGLAGGVLGFIGGPFAARVMNDIWGVQTSATTRNPNDKRSIHLNFDDMTFDEARDVFISHYVEKAFAENPDGANTDAAVCTSSSYRVSDPAKTVDATALKFSAKGQEVEYDCFLLEAPVTFEVSNATDATFAYVAQANATFTDGILTIV